MRVSCNCHFKLLGNLVCVAAYPKSPPALPVVRSQSSSIPALLACGGLVPTLLSEIRQCTALTSCLIFLTSTIMHFGLRVSLQKWPRRDLPHDITTCQKDVLCGCNTQLILQLSH